jgi:hypothetical protein
LEYTHFTEIGQSKLQEVLAIFPKSCRLQRQLDAFTYSTVDLSKYVFSIEAGCGYRYKLFFSILA